MTKNLKRKIRMMIRRYRAHISLKKRAMEKPRDDGLRVYDAVISSDDPIQMWWGTEILEHKAENVDFEAVSGGRCMLLDGHGGAPAGRVEEAILEGGKASCKMLMMEDGRSGEIADMWDKGIGTNLSVGYSIQETKRNHDTDEVFVTRWTLLEVSMVGVPADKNAGITRADGSPAEHPDMEFINSRSEKTKKQKTPERDNPLDTPKTDPISDPKIEPEKRDDPVDTPKTDTKPEPAKSEGKKMTEEERKALNGARDEFLAQAANSVTQLKLNPENKRAAEDAANKHAHDATSQAVTLDAARNAFNVSLLEIAGKQSNSEIKEVDVTPDGQKHSMLLKHRLGNVDYLRMIKDSKIQESIGLDHFLRAAVINKVPGAGGGGSDKITGFINEFQQENLRQVPDGARTELQSGGFTLPAELIALHNYRAAVAEAKRLPPHLRGERIQSITGDTGGKGGLLVETDVRLELLVEHLYSSAKLAEFGAMMLNGLTNDILIPRQTSKSTAAYYTENQTIVMSDYTIGSLSLKPHRIGAQSAYTLQSLINVSGNFMPSLTMSTLMNTLHEQRDADFLNSDGTGSKPLGIMNTSGITLISHGTNGGKVTYALTRRANLEIKNADVPGMPRKMMTPGIMEARYLTQKKIGDTDSQFIYDQNDPHIEGNPMWTNSLNSKGTKGTGINLHSEFTCIPNELICAMWGDIYVSIDADSASTAADGEVVVTIQAFNDIAVRRVDAFVGSKDINTSVV